MYANGVLDCEIEIQRLAGFKMYLWTAKTGTGAIPAQFTL